MYRQTLLWCLLLVISCNLIGMDNFYRGKETSPKHIEFSQEKLPGADKASEELYAQVVKTQVIPCVDVFVVNLKTNTYFILNRKDEPARGFDWIPGGRHQKEESFAQVAERKCRDEVGMTVTIQAILGTYSTTFPRSEWNCSTHTVNTVVLAFCEDDRCNLDAHHERGRWISLDVEPGNAYLDAAYNDMLEALKTYKIAQLHAAIESQNLSEVNTALKNLSTFPKTTINQKINGKKALEVAVSLENNSDNREIVKILMQAGATVSPNNNHKLNLVNGLHQIIIERMREHHLTKASFFTPAGSR